MRLRSPLDERSRILLGHLHSGDAKREAYVRTALAEMDQDEAVSLLLSWAEHGEQAQLRSLATICAAMGMLALLVVGLSVLVTDDHHVQIGGIGCVLAPIISYVAASARVRRRITAFLATYDDKRILNALVSQVRSGDSETSRAAEVPLIRLLPTLRPEDKHILSPQSRFALNNCLLECTYPPLVRAILDAWVQVGDQHSVHCVERVSRGEGALGGDFSIRHAAAEALPAIREAANRAAIAETLLRAANPNESSSALLRPASSADTVDQVLLRPTD